MKVQEPTEAPNAWASHAIPETGLREAVVGACDGDRDALQKLERYFFALGAREPWAMRLYVALRDPLWAATLSESGRRDLLGYALQAGYSRTTFWLRCVSLALSAEYPEQSAALKEIPLGRRRWLVTQPDVDLIPYLNDTDAEVVTRALRHPRQTESGVIRLASRRNIAQKPLWALIRSKWSRQAPVLRALANNSGIDRGCFGLLLPLLPADERNALTKRQRGERLEYLLEFGAAFLR